MVKTHDGFIKLTGVVPAGEFRSIKSRSARKLEERIGYILLAVLAVAAIIFAFCCHRSSEKEKLPTLLLDGKDRIKAVCYEGKPPDTSPAEIQKWIGDSRCPREYLVQSYPAPQGRGKK